MTQNLRTYLLFLFIYIVKNIYTQSPEIIIWIEIIRLLYLIVIWILQVVLQNYIFEINTSVNKKKYRSKAFLLYLYNNEHSPNSKTYIFRKWHIFWQIYVNISIVIFDMILLYRFTLLYSIYVRLRFKFGFENLSSFVLIKFSCIHL